MQYYLLFFKAVQVCIGVVAEMCKNTCLCLCGCFFWGVVSVSRAAAVSPPLILNISYYKLYERETDGEGEQPTAHHPLSLQDPHRHSHKETPFHRADILYRFYEMIYISVFRYYSLPNGPEENRSRTLSSICREPPVGTALSEIVDE